MGFTVLYHPQAQKDIEGFDRKLKDRMRRAIETRLMTEPHRYGTPLRRTLKGYWKLRVGDYRIVFKIAGVEIVILGIIHRRVVYQEIDKRT